MPLRDHSRSPIWLTDELSISLDLEVSYEQTCQILRLVRAEPA
jgi:hypothetical protein